MTARSIDIDVEVEEGAETRPRETGRLDVLTRILRSTGSLAFVAGVSVFLFQHWDRGDDIQRYLLLLAQSVSICVAGIACGLWMREAKGARTLLALGLSTVPVQFSVLGSLLYSCVAWGSTQVTYLPDFARWTAPSMSAALTTLGGASIVLCAISALAFAVLARPHALVLTAAFLAANALLVLPMRDPDGIACVLAVAGIGLAWVLRGPLRRGAPLHSFEGRYARVMLCAPLGVLAARSLGFYATSAYLSSVLVAGLAWLVYQAPAAFQGTPSRQQACRAIALTTGGYAWWLFVMGVRQTLGVPDALFLPLISLPFAGILATLSLHAPESGAAYRRAAGGIAVVGALVNVVSVGGLLPGLLCAVTGIGVVSYGFMVQQRLLLVLGACASVLGILAQLRIALAIYSPGYALSLGVLGIGTILVASLLERHHRRIAARLAELRGQLRDWDN